MLETPSLPSLRTPPASFKHQKYDSTTKKEEEKGSQFISFYKAQPSAASSVSPPPPPPPQAAIIKTTTPQMNTAALPPFRSVSSTGTELTVSTISSHHSLNRLNNYRDRHQDQAYDETLLLGDYEYDVEDDEDWRLVAPPPHQQQMEAPSRKPTSSPTSYFVATTEKLRSSSSSPPSPQMKQQQYYPPIPMMITPNLKSLRKGGTILSPRTHRRGGSGRFSMGEDGKSYVIEVPINDLGADISLISSPEDFPQVPSSSPTSRTMNMVFGSPSRKKNKDPNTADEDDEDEDDDGFRNIPLLSRFLHACTVPEDQVEAMNQDIPPASASHFHKTSSSSPRSPSLPVWSSASSSHRRHSAAVNNEEELKWSPSLDAFQEPPPAAETTAAETTATATRIPSSPVFPREIGELFHQAQSTITEQVDQVRLQLTALQSSWLPPIPVTTTNNNTKRRRRSSGGGDSSSNIPKKQQAALSSYSPPVPVTPPSGDDSLWEFPDGVEPKPEAVVTRVNVNDDDQNYHPTQPVVIHVATVVSPARPKQQRRGLLEQQVTTKEPTSTMASF